ncbi:unnamed protein product [Symbiodinium necroappetens]|uniref:Uncharacterized protein n=1 Tax=Symbiodinium necroappetens TaxID=1628268 RepID=A0A812SU24_9DINO|nr:unnamed protein product [Symbiodinium necroappetens]
MVLVAVERTPVLPVSRTAVRTDDVVCLGGLRKARDLRHGAGAPWCRAQGPECRGDQGSRLLRQNPQRGWILQHSSASTGRYMGHRHNDVPRRRAVLRAWEAGRDKEEAGKGFRSSRAVRRPGIGAACTDTRDRLAQGVHEVALRPVGGSSVCKRLGGQGRLHRGRRAKRVHRLCHGRSSCGTGQHGRGVGHPDVLHEQGGAERRWQGRPGGPRHLGAARDLRRSPVAAWSRAEDHERRGDKESRRLHPGSPREVQLC